VLYSSGGRASLRAAAASENWVGVGVMLRYMCVCVCVCVFLNWIAAEARAARLAQYPSQEPTVTGTHRDNRSACHCPCGQHKRMPLHSNVRLQEAHRILGKPYPHTR